MSWAKWIWILLVFVSYSIWSGMSFLSVDPLYAQVKPDFLRSKKTSSDTTGSTTSGKTWNPTKADVIVGKWRSEGTARIEISGGNGVYTGVLTGTRMVNGKPSGTISMKIRNLKPNGQGVWSNFSGEVDCAPMLKKKGSSWNYFYVTYMSAYGDNPEKIMLDFGCTFSGNLPDMYRVRDDKNDGMLHLTKRTRDDLATLNDLIEANDKINAYVTLAPLLDLLKPIAKGKYTAALRKLPKEKWKDSSDFVVSNDQNWRKIYYERCMTYASVHKRLGNKDDVKFWEQLAVTFQSPNNSESSTKKKKPDFIRVIP